MILIERNCVGSLDFTESRVVFEFIVIFCLSAGFETFENII